MPVKENSPAKHFFLLGEASFSLSEIVGVLWFLSGGFMCVLGLGTFLIGLLKKRKVRAA